MKRKEYNFPERTEGKLNVYFHVSENSGVGFYREYLPALKLRENKLANTMINDFQWGKGEQKSPEAKDLFAIMNWADLVVVGRLDIPNFYAIWGGIKEFFHIPVIMDTDDNVHHVRPSNPGYQGYHPGSENLLWNEYSMAKIFDAVTVSTRNLQLYYKKHNPRIYCLPNNIDLKWWDGFELKKQEHKRFRFGFIGSAAHGEGIQIIKKPVLRFLEKYPDTEFCVTSIFDIYFRDVPEKLRNQIVYVPWIDLAEFPKGLQEVNFDVGLAPLADNLFNRGKSNLRWMEFSASRVPLIASPVEPYLCIRNGVDGVFAKEQDDWLAGLEMLYLDKEKRGKIARNARETIEREYDIDKNISLWDNAYREVVEKYRAFYGAKRKFLQQDDGKWRELKF